MVAKQVLLAWRLCGKCRLAVAIVMMAAGVANAGDVEVGEIIAAPCVACHGVAGAKPIADYPILAGQDEKYLLHTLRLYKSGARKNAVMAGLVDGLSDADMQNLAAYFSAQDSPLR